MIDPLKATQDQVNAQLLVLEWSKKATADTSPAARLIAIGGLKAAVDLLDACERINLEVLRGR